VQVVQVDDGELLVLGGDTAARPRGEVSADDRAQRPKRRAQPADERVDCAGPCDRAGPVRAAVLIGQPVDDEIDQFLVGGQHLAAEEHRPVVAERFGLPAQPGRDLVNDDRVLVPVILGVREHVGQQLLVAELPQGPPERLDAAGAPGDVRPACGVVGDRRRPEAGRRERLGRQAEHAVVGPQVVIEADVRLVEEQQVLALHAEHERLGVDRPRAEGTGAEDGVQQEQREAGLRRHTGDTADRHVGAAGAVKELHVDVDRGAVPAAPHRDPVGHLVEVQGLGPLAARRAADHVAWAGRHVDLRFHPGGADLRDLLCPGRQHALGNEEDVGAEARTLLPGPHLCDDAAAQHRPYPWNVPERDHHVVELEVGRLVEGNGELQRRRVLRPRHQADLVRRPARRRGAAWLAATRQQEAAPRRAVQA